MSSPLSLDSLLKKYDTKPDGARFYNPAELEELQRVVHQRIGVVCQIQTPTEKGTGCLIEGNLLITNYHVIPDKETAAKSYALFFRVTSQDADKNRTTIQLIRLKVDPSRYFYSSPDKKEKDLILPADAEHLDFTIFALESDPYLEEVKDQVVSIFNKIEPEMKALACILQHPDVVDSTTVLKGDLKWAIGIVHQREGCSIHYDTETAPGSSGGAVINKKGDLIALHYQGLDKCGCDPNHPNCNAGVLMTEISQHLEQKGERAKIEEVIKNYHKESSLRFEQFIQSLATHLISFYQKQMTEVYRIRAKGAWTISLPIEGVYTNLAIICEEERKTKSDLNQTFQDKRIPTHETLFKPKQPIAPQDIFKHGKLKDAHQKRAVVFGVAGVGKTTFCQMLALKGTKLWPQFKVIFFIKLRHLNEKEYPVRLEGYTPAELLAKECCFDLAKYQTLLNDPKFFEEALLLLDGYDELPKEAESGSLSKAFKTLKELFPHILITSRPTLVDINYATEMEILGFDPQSVETYIEKFYGLLVQRKELSEEEAKRKTQKLQKEIKKPILASLLQIPINLSLACSLCREDETFFDYNQTTSVTSFYIETSNWFYKKYQLRPGVSTLSEASIRQQRNPRSMCKKIDHLAKAYEEIAWWAMQQNTLYIDQNIIENILKPSELNLEDLTHLGLLSIEEGQGQFIHLSFQEYFAATYLARFYLEGKREKNLLQEIKFNPRYSLILPMLAGYLSCQENPAALQAFFDDLLSEPYDLAIGYELRLLARCFEECKDPKIISQYRNFIEDVIIYLKDNPLTKLKVNLLARNPRLFCLKEVIQVFKCDLEDDKKQKNALDLLKELVVQGQILPQEILRMITSILKDPKADSSAKRSAASALEAVAKSGQTLPKDTLEVLIALIKDPKADIFAKSSAASALEAVAKRGQALPKDFLEALIAFLQDPKADYFAKRYAASALGEVAKNGQASSKDTLEALIVLIKDPKTDSFAKSFAASALEAVAKSGQVSSKDALETLIALIKDPKADSSTKSSAASALGEVVKSGQASSKDTLEALIVLIKDPKTDSSVKSSAASALGEVAKSGQVSSKDALEALIALIKDPKAGSFAERSVASALEAVAKSGQTLPKDALEVLIALIQDPKADSFAKSSAASALEAVAKRGQALPKDALEALIALVQDPEADSFAKRSAASALEAVAKSGQTLPKDALEVLIALIKDPEADSFAKRSAASALEAVAKSGQTLPKDTLEALIALIKDPKADSSAKSSAASALEAVAKRGQTLPKDTLEVLIALIQDPKADSSAKCSAASALGEVVKSGQALSKDMLEALIEVTNDQRGQLYASYFLDQVAEGCCKLNNKYDYKVLGKLFYLTGGAFFYQKGIFYTSSSQTPLISESSVDCQKVYQDFLKSSKLHPPKAFLITPNQK